MNNRADTNKQAAMQAVAVAVKLDGDGHLKVVWF
jgi:hypothetical protein